MKLLDLLVKELPKMGGWPVRAISIAQDGDGHAWGYNCENLTLQPHGWWRSKSGDAICTDGIKLYQMASDWNSTFVTRAQYESALAASDGWIEWVGGECPVPGDTDVLIKCKSEVAWDYLCKQRADEVSWQHDDSTLDIIAYRLHKPQQEEQPDASEEDLNDCIGQAPATLWNGRWLPSAGCECEYQYKVHGSEWCRFECIAVDGKAVFGWSNNTPVALQSNTHNFRPLRTEAEKAREKLAASLHIAAGASPIELNGIGHLYFKLADAIISGSVFGTTFKEIK